MRILRVYNNNIVATKTVDDREAIAQGAGIGFGKKPGDLLDQKKVDKYYYILSEHQNRFRELFEETSIEYFQLAEKIIGKAKLDLQADLSNQIVLGLSDHIHFAVQREREGIRLPNLMLDEIRTLYQEEFQIALWSLDLINETMEVKLPLDEAGYIALHIVNASMGIEAESTSNILMFTKGVLDVIRSSYNITLDVNSLDTSRLLTHLKFLAYRIFSKEQLKMNVVEGMYEHLVSKDKKLKSCINEIDVFIMSAFDYQISPQERVYLMIHILRVL